MALRRELQRAGELLAVVDALARAPGEERGPAHIGAGLARDLCELVEQQALAGGRLQHAAPGLAERARQRADLGKVGGAARYRPAAIADMGR